ncbi:MAG: leucine-rich repeat domain-containing protein [Odoribacter sp.]|nr:leucine-rich repeat domain-containing protein [Odoribacter sp.]
MFSILKRLLGIILLAVNGTAAVSAQSFEVDGIYYTVTSDGESVAVVQSPDDNKYTGEIVIPPTVEYDGKAYTVTLIGGSAFQGCGITSVELPSTIEIIGMNSFRSCNNLRDINIPSSVTQISDYAFYWTKGLYSLKITTPEITMGREVFRYSSLNEITFLCNTIKWADNIAFGGVYLKSLTTTCNILTGISGMEFVAYRSDVTNIGNNPVSKLIPNKSFAFPATNYTINDNGLIYSADKTILYFVPGTFNDSLVIPATVETFAYKEDCNYTPFNNHIYLTSVKLPETITEVAPRLFEGCSALESVSLGSAVTSIGVAAFDGCTGLTDINIPSTVRSIGRNAFSYCSNLKEITIPTGMTAIEAYTYEYCRSVSHLILPATLESIGSNAFGNCTGLAEIESHAMTPPVCMSSTFANLPECRVKVPAEALDAYRAADVWKDMDLEALPVPVTLTVKGCDSNSIIFHYQEGETACLAITPTNGWKISSVQFNGDDVTDSLTDCKLFTTPALTGGNTLEIIMEKNPVQTVEDAAADYNTVNISIRGTQVEVSGLDVDSEITVTDLYGRLIYRGNNHTVSLSPGAVYILATPSKTFKFAI